MIEWIDRQPWELHSRYRINEKVLIDLLWWCSLLHRRSDGILEHLLAFNRWRLLSFLKLRRIFHRVPRACILLQHLLFHWDHFLWQIVHREVKELRATCCSVFSTVTSVHPISIRAHNANFTACALLNTLLLIRNGADFIWASLERQISIRSFLICGCVCHSKSRGKALATWLDVQGLPIESLLPILLVPVLCIWHQLLNRGLEESFGGGGLIRVREQRLL